MRPPSTRAGIGYDLYVVCVPIQGYNRDIVELTGNHTAFPFHTVQRINPDLDDKELEMVLKDPKLHYHLLDRLQTAFLLEGVFVMYRRIMLGAIRNPSVAVAACIFTALEEALFRSTMVHRDTFISNLIGKPEPTAAEVIVQRKIWSAASAMSMYIEVTSIITSRALYIVFRPHRL